MSYGLRPYQINAVNRTREAFASGKRRIVIVAPTGAGKTVIGCHLIESAKTKGTRVLFLAHRKELIDQCSRKLDENGIFEHGIIKADHWRTDYSRPVQVASIQTFIRRMDKIPWERWKFGMVMVDEAHHAVSKSYRTVLDLAQADGIPIIGLTATPYRADGKGLGTSGLFEVLIPVTTTQALVEDDFLTPSKVFAAAGPDLTKIKTVAGDYKLDDLGDEMDKAILVGDIVKNWTEHASGLATVCFAVNVAHSKHIVEQFKLAGVKAEHLDGTMSDEEREGILARLASGETTLVSNCGVLTEGFDLPRIECVILARPTKSRGLWRQMVGRGLRPWTNPINMLEKLFCIILDHAGCTYTHGFVTDPDDLSLEDGLKKPSKGKARRFRCPECKAEIGSWPKFCPSCGTSLRDTEPQEIHVDTSMDLEEVTPQTIRRKFFHQMSRRAFLGGYQPGYPWAKFKEKFGRWPIHAETTGCEFKTKKIVTRHGPQRFWVVSSEEMLRQMKTSRSGRSLVCTCALEIIPCNVCKEPSNAGRINARIEAEKQPWDASKCTCAVSRHPPCGYCESGSYKSEDAA